MSLFVTLVRDELGFCCPYSFLRECEGKSRNKIAEALGVDQGTVRYWHTKKFRGTLRRCENCKKPQPILTIKRRKSGQHYFERNR